MAGNEVTKDNIEFLKELFDQKLDPIIKSIDELKKSMNRFENLPYRVRVLEHSKKKYKIEFLNAVAQLTEFNLRLNELHNDFQNLQKESITCKNSCSKQVENSVIQQKELIEKQKLEIQALNAKIEEDRKSLFFVHLASKYYRQTLLIIIALVLLGVSGKYANIINFFYKF